MYENTSTLLSQKEDEVGLLLSDDSPMDPLESRKQAEVCIESYESIRGQESSGVLY